MSLSTLRTTFEAKDLERAAKAHRHYGWYERLGEPGSCHHLTASPPDKGEPTQLDSGLGDELPEEDDPPSPPKLLGIPPSVIADSENQDSGLGTEPEHMSEEEDDDVVSDCALISAPFKATPQPERPRKPKTTQILQTHNAPNLTLRRSPHHTSGKSVSAESNVIPSTPFRTTTVTNVSPALRLSTPTSWQNNEQLTQDNLHYFLPNRDGDTGLHLSVIHSKIEVLNRLLRMASRDSRLLRGVLDEQNCLFQTALHLATHTQQTEMMRKLLMAGASPHLTDHKGNSPMHIACKFSSTKCLDEILRYTTLRNIRQIARIRNNDGLSCVHVAARHGNRDALRKIRSMGVDLNMQDFHSGKTALHIAVEKNSLPDVQFLVENCEVDVNATTYSCCTPLHVAAGRGDIVMVAYLLSMGGNPDLLTDEGDTALDLAGSEQVLVLLTKAEQLSQLF